MLVSKGQAGESGGRSEGALSDGDVECAVKDLVREAVSHLRFMGDRVPDSLATGSARELLSEVASVYFKFSPNQQRFMMEKLRSFSS
jgi:hypothetical protein